MFGLAHVVHVTEIRPLNSGQSRRQVGRDPDRRQEVGGYAAWVLHRSDAVRAGCAGGVHQPGADLHAGGDWEVGLP